MKQVQIQTLKTKPQKYSTKYIINGSLPQNLRSVKDRPCCLIFMILALIFIACLTIAIKTGYPKQFIYVTGQGYRCGFGQAQLFPYAYFYNPLVNNKTVCADKCPTYINGQLETIKCYFNFKCTYNVVLNQSSQYSDTLKSQKVLGYPTYPTVGNICLPSLKLFQNSLKQSKQIIYQRISQTHNNISYIDIYNNSQYIAITVSISIFITIIMCIILYNCVILYKQYMYIGSIVISIILTFIIAMISFYQSGIIPIDDNKYIGYLGLSYKSKQVRYLSIAIVFILVSVIFIIILIVTINRNKNIQLKIQPHSNNTLTFSSNNNNNNKNKDNNTTTQHYQNNNMDNIYKYSIQQIILLIIFTIIYIIHWIISIFVFIWLITGIKINYQKDTVKLFTQITSQFDINKLLAAYMIFWAIYCGYFIIGLYKVMLALILSQNNAINKKYRKYPIFDTLIIVLYHHFCSLVFAGFIVPIFGNILQFVLYSFKINITKKTFLNYIAKILKLCSNGLYIHIAIQGSSYLKSCNKSYQLMWKSSHPFYQAKYRVQIQYIMISFCKCIITLFGSFIIQFVLVFTFKIHINIFQPLWVICIGWLVNYGIADLFMFKYQAMSRISLLNCDILSKQEDNENQISNSKEKQKGKGKLNEIIQLPPLKRPNFDQHTLDELNIKPKKQEHDIYKLKQKEK